MSEYSDLAEKLLLGERKVMAEIKVDLVNALNKFYSSPPQVRDHETYNIFINTIRDYLEYKKLQGLIYDYYVPQNFDYNNLFNHLLRVEVQERPSIQTIQLTFDVSV